MSENVTTKFRVDISDLKKNIAEANRQVKLYRAEMQNANAGMQKGEETADSLTRKIEAQGKIVEAEKAKLEAMRDELARYEETLSKGAGIIDDLTRKHEDAAKAYGEDSEEAKKLAEQLRKAQEAQERNLTATDALRTEIVKQDTAVKNAAAQVGVYSDALKRLDGEESSFTSTVKKQEEELARLREQYINVAAAQGKDSEEAKILAGRISELSAALQDNRQKLSEAKGAADTLDHTVQDTGDAFQKTADGGLDAFAVALGNLVSDVIGRALDGIKELASSVVDVGKTFDSSLSKVKAISGASEEETAQLKAMAEELGRTTKFTAAEVADGMSYMAMAGWKTSDILKNIGPVLQLATASGEDLALTSDIVTDALTAFGLKSEDTQYFVDTLAQTAANANTNVALMGETFKYCAPLAGALGYSLDDMSVMIGAMASQGIKASQAGTSLRRILSDLSDDFTVSGEKTGDMTIQVQNADGSMRSLYDVVMDTRRAFSQLTEAERVNQAKTLVGQNAMSGFLTLMNATDEDIQKLRGSLDDAGGAAEQMASTMQDNLGGKMVEFDSAMDGFKKKVYEGMVDPLTDLVVLATERVIPEMNELADDFAAWMQGFEEENGSLAEHVSAFLDTAIPAAKEFLQWVKDNGPEIESTLVGIVTAIAAFKAVTMIQQAVAAFQALAAVIELVGVKQAALNLIMSANPIGIIIAAVAGLAAFLITMYNTNDEFREKVDLWGESLLETFDMWGEKLKDFWENWKDGAKDIKDGWDNFRDSWETGADAISEKAKAFWAWITDRHDDFKTGWQSIKDGWVEFWDNVRVGLGVIRDLINEIVGLMNKLPGVDIPEIGAADVFAPKMARGGIVDRPTLAQIGEAGREAVIPLEHNREGLRELARAIREEMGAAPAAGQAQGGGVTVNYTQNISSPKELSTYEIWRQSRNMTDLIRLQLEGV